jgi:branched-chain amino acid transport system substrate-binding protein
VKRRAFLGAAALAAVALPVPAQAPRGIAVGAVVPLTGLSESWGQRTWNGLRFACDLVNEGGGIRALAGAPLRCLVGDTQSKPDVALLGAKRLISAGAVAVVGCNQSAASMLVSELAQRWRVPFITPTDLEPILTSRGNTFTFRTAATVDAHAHDLLAFVRALGQRAGAPPRRLAIVSQRSVMGEVAAEGARRAAEGFGYDVVGTTLYATDAPGDIGADLRRYRAAGAAVVVGHHGLDDAVWLTRAMAEVNFDPRAYGGILGAEASAAYARVLGPLAEGVLGTSAWATGIDVPGLTLLAHQFRERFGGELDAPAAAGVSAVAVLRDALERAGTADPVALRDAVAATDLRAGERMLLQYHGVKFLPNGDNARAGGLVMVVAGGLPRTVAPREYARTTAAYPKRRWVLASRG